MWLSLYACWILCCLFLMVPGYFLAKALRCDRTVALLAAPLMSCGIYGVLAIVYGKVGIPCGWVMLAALPSLVGAALCMLESRLKVTPLEALSLSDELRRPVSERLHISVGTASIAAAVITGAVVSEVIWVSSLTSPDVFIQLFDNGFHLTHIAEFMESSNYSSFGRTGFYPSVWHSLAAMAGSAVGAAVPVAESGSLVAMATVAYPLSCTFLLITLFADKPRRVFLGSLFCLSVAFFPWRPMLWGPLYPNIAAFCVMTAEEALFIRLVARAQGATERLACGLLFVAGGVSLALVQPNAIFSCGLFLIPFCLNYTRRTVSARRGVRAGVIAELALLVAFAALWMGLVYAPFMHSVVWYPRSNSQDYMQAVRWALDLCFIIRRPQYFAGAILVLGGLFVLREPEMRWIDASYAMTFLTYVSAFGFPSPWLHIISGFWYSEHWRCASMVCVAAIPLIACGMDALVGFVTWPFTKSKVADEQGPAERRPSVVSHVVATVAVVMVMAVNYFPLDVIPLKYRCYGFDTVKHNVHTTTDPALFEWAPLPPEENEFLEKVAAVVGDSRVLNNPFDGSAFAYALHGINTEYRTFGPFDVKGRPLRKGVDKITKNAKVQHDVKEHGIEYVLQLDHGDAYKGLGEDATYIVLAYNYRGWKGINGVRDDTPGFTVVLSEGDMRLYKIEMPES